MRVIYVGNDIGLHTLMSALLGTKFDNVLVHTAEQALELMALGENFKAFIVANNGGKGLKFLTVVSEKYPLTVRVLMSGGNMSEDIKQAISKGYVTRLVSTPFNAHQFLEFLENDISLLPV